jgi:hypothetical protein
MRLVLTLFLCLLIQSTVSAELWTTSEETRSRYGEEAVIEARLTSPNAVAGLSGEMLFDPTAFSSPQISPGPAQPDGTRAVGYLIDKGKTEDGEMIAPARYRFAVFANPLAGFSTSAAVVTFSLHVIETESTTRQISFEMEAASETDLDLYSNVEFAPVTVILNTNDAKDWVLYE